MDAKPDTADLSGLTACLNEAPCGLLLLEPVAGAAGGPDDFIVKLANRAFLAFGLVPDNLQPGASLVKALGGRPHWLEVLAATAIDGAGRKTIERNDRQGRTYAIKTFRPASGTVGAVIEDISERVSYEEMLRRDAVKYRTIFENIQDVYFETDRHGLLLEISPSVTTMLGYRREDMVGTPIDALFRNPAEAGRIRERLLSSGPESDHEVELLDGEGNLLYCVLTATLRREGASGRDRICGSLHNATDRKLHEMAVKASEARLRDVIDLVPYPIFARDAEGRYLLGNKALAAFHARPLDAIIGHAIGDFGRAPAEWEPMAATDRQVIETQEAVFLSDAALTDGHGRVHYFQIYKVPCDLRGKGKKDILGIGIDVTERREAEQDRLRLAMAAEQATEAIVITDAAGIIQYVNPALERISGYSRKECIGLTPRVLKSGKHPESFYKQMWETLKQGEAWHGHLTNKRKDGTLYEEYTTITPVRDASGAVANFIAVKRDISRELQIQERLQQAQKMEAIGTLAGGIAHDFNNILAAMVGYTELVRNQLPEGGRARSDLEQVLLAGKRAGELVSQIRMFGRETEGERKPMQIGPIVKEAVKLLRASIPSTIEIRKHIGRDCGAVVADAAQIHQLVMNLCTNAYHAMPDGGVLEISLQRVSLDGAKAAEHPRLREGEYALLSVSDTGTGIREELIERIFDPYFTTREKGGGTGLGLSTVHGIVATMQGAIEVSSEIGKGSRFDIYLPAHEKAAAASALDDAPIPTGNGERVLWVDDEIAILHFGKEMLERIGYQVVTAEGSIQALELFQKDPARFDIVLTDQTMPKMTGAQMIEAMRVFRRDIPFVLSTGFSDSLSEQTLQRLQLRGFIEKPFSLSDLARVIRSAIDGDL